MLSGLQEDYGYLHCLYKRTVRTKQQAASRNKRGANLIILAGRYIREKEGGRTFSATTSRCWNHLPLKLRASQWANTLKNALYKHFKLSQLTPFLDNLFLDCMI